MYYLRHFKRQTLGKNEFKSCGFSTLSKCNIIENNTIDYLG